MIPNTCIEIQTEKFLILPGEEDEVVNEGMYGKALSLYLEDNLRSIGIECDQAVAEDWGWWQEVSENGFKLGLRIYSQSEPNEHPHAYAIISSKTSPQNWSWSKFRKVDISNEVTSIMDKIETIFKSDSEITSVQRHDEYPFQ